LNSIVDNVTFYEQTNLDYRKEDKIELFL
jgi:hypothetical protein